MVKVMTLTNTDSNLNSYKIVAFADTKEEVNKHTMYIGLPAGATIEMGSVLMTAAKECAFMQSDGEWNWG